MDEKKAQEQIDELLELVSEFKFHEFVQLVIIITKPARDKRMLELDDELKEDGEESTSEASSSEMEDDGEESEEEKDRKEEKKEKTPVKAISRKSSSRLGSLDNINSPMVGRIRSRLRAGSIRKEGLLQYVNFVTKKDTMDWFRSNGPASDGTISPGTARNFMEMLASVLRLKDWKEPLDTMLEYLGVIKYYEFVQLFLAVSRASREANDLKIDDELAGEEEDSTSEASDDEDKEKHQNPPKITLETVW